MQTNMPAIAAKNGILPPESWNELHDFLSLALDALGDSPEDFSSDFLCNSVMHQRLALRITHKALERLNGGAA